MTIMDDCQEGFAGKLVLTPREAAAALGVSERTLYSYEKEGRLKPIRLSTQTKRYRLADLHAFLDAAAAAEVS